MTCPCCQTAETRIIRTVPGRTVSRHHECKRCQRRWWTDEKLRRGSIQVAHPQAISSPSVARQSSSPQVLDPPSLSLIALSPDQTHARKSKENADVFPVVGDPDNPTWSITDEEFQTLQDAYPDLDIAQQSKCALSWVKASPANRKTFGGMMRFLNGWMARNQNNGAARKNGVHRGGHAPAEVKDRPSGEVKL